MIDQKLWVVCLGSIVLLVGCMEQPVDGDTLAPVALETSHRLDFSSAPTLPSEGAGLLASDPARDRFAFVDPMVPHEVLLFGSGGDFEAVIGAQGDGPGEYTRIQAVVFDSEGNLWVFERDGSTADVWRTEMELERSVRLDRAVRRAAPLRDGHLLVVTTSGSGPRVERLTPDGDLIDTELEVPTNAGGAVADLIAVASDGDECYWVAVPYEWPLFKGCMADDVRGLDLEEPTWFGHQFRAEIRSEFGGVVDTSGTTILTLEYDSSRGLLWLSAGVPSPDVRAVDLRAAMDAPVEERTRMLVDHVVMGIDVEREVPVAQERFDYRAISLASQHQYVVSEAELLTVLRPEVGR